MDDRMRGRIRGCAVGAAVGDALGMPLEFGPRQPADRLVREMRAGRVPSGTFTDDTEMALALAESLLAHLPLDPKDLATRFLGWYRMGPDDVGVHTGAVLERIDLGEDWEGASRAAQRVSPGSAGNGSVMRCWPAALAHWSDLEGLLADSRLQSRVTHAHPECEAACAFVNAAIYRLLRGSEPKEAVAQAVTAIMRSVGRKPVQVARDILWKQMDDEGGVGFRPDQLVALFGGFSADALRDRISPGRGRRDAAAPAEE